MSKQVFDPEQAQPGWRKAPKKLARSAGASPAQVRPQRAAWKRVLREPAATPAAKRTQRLRGGCDWAYRRGKIVSRVERNMSDAVLRGIAALPGSKSTSRAKGSCRSRQVTMGYA